MHDFMPELTCVGCGPGDPELLTVKAVNAIKNADVIMCPTSKEGKSSIALSVVSSLIDQNKNPEIVNLVFPMTKDKDILENTWQKNSQIIAESVLSGKKVVYLTVGDPYLYSTWIYLHREISVKHPDINITVIPGIVSMFTFASKIGISLAEGAEKMAVIPSFYNLCKKGKLHNAAKLIREEIFNLLKNNAKKNKLVVRLHDGDPTIYGAIKEQIDNLEKEGIKSEIIPLLTSFFSSAAAIGTQLTLPGVTQTIIITRAEKRTKVPKREKISELAKHKATMIFYLSVHLLSDIVKEVIAGGYTKSSPAAVVYRASWGDHKIITGTLNDITKKVWDEKITRTAIVIIGDVVKPTSYEYSKLYDKTFSHGYRKSKIKQK